MDTVNPYELPDRPVVTVGKTPKSIIKKLGLILVSLIMGILFHMAGILVGSMVTGVVTRRIPA